VPAVAVRREEQALSIMTGRKRFYGGFLSFKNKIEVVLKKFFKLINLRVY